MPSSAFKSAGPKILEPIYDVEVLVPSDKLGGDVLIEEGVKKSSGISQ